jgi:hypothetical protein
MSPGAHVLGRTGPGGFEEVIAGIPHYRSLPRRSLDQTRNFPAPRQLSTISPHDLPDGNRITLYVLDLAGDSEARLLKGSGYLSPCHAFNREVPAWWS